MSSPAEPQMRPARSIIDLLNPISIDIPPAPKVQRQPEVKPRYTHPSRDAHYGLARATPTASMRTSASSVAGPSHQDQALPRVHQHIVGSLYENDMASALPWLVEPTSYPPISPMYSDERTAVSGDPSREQQHPSSYQPRGSPEIDYSTWQTVERASPRLVANKFSPSFTNTNPSYRGELEQEDRRQQVSQKRRVFDVEDAEEPPKSKRKLSAKPPRSSSGTNRRSGYTAKKRSEAAQMAALNEYLTDLCEEEAPNIMYKVAPQSKDGDDAPYTVIPVEFPDVSNVIKELQVSRCMSNRYRNEEKVPRCVSCTRRWAGDTCRFQNIRSFCRDSEGNIAGIIFQEQPTPSTKMDYPDKWNIPLEKNHIHEIKKTIAAALLPTLREELEHVNQTAVICRPRESEVRATCDTCLTSIFSCSWMCRQCGREACAECYEQVKMLTIEPNGASQSKIDELLMRREKQLHVTPFFLGCMKRNEHGAKDFSPVTRFSKDELEAAIREMVELLRDEGSDVAAPFPAALTSKPLDTTSSTSDSSELHAPPDVAPSPLSNDSEATLISNGETAQHAEPVASGSTTEIPSHEIQRFTDAELTEEVFRPIWAKGDPLLVTDVAHKLKIDWSPKYFMDKYGAESCLIIECQTEQSKRITVHEFFSDFGKYNGREQCWKLKDWPPSSDFKTSFPELYEDFSRAVPIPNYVRRDGALNIASHFPSNTVGPDLGPKMYNANANREESNSKGSTRLHMDMADALNIMTYAAPDPDGGEGRAAWDLFRAQDSEKIRTFMRSKFSLLQAPDPIHSQQVYLDDDARRELFAEYGVKSYRVYQTPGQAVFIPAGCAHQVRNLSDCIKVAIDFVSPENIQRCEKLTREFREQNQSKAWKEDVLQLRTMMWFAWLSCCRQEKLAAS